MVWNSWSRSCVVAWVKLLHAIVKGLQALANGQQRLERIVHERFNDVMGQLEDLAAQLSAAADAITTGLANEQQAIQNVAADVADLAAKLTAAPTVTQATLDSLSAIGQKLTAAAGTIGQHATALQNIVTPPAAPAAPAPAATDPGTTTP